MKSEVKEYVLKMLEKNGSVLKYVDKEMQGDKEVVLVAVERSGGALEYASEELKGDKEVVLAAVKQYGPALEYASEELRGDKEVILAAYNSNPRALYLASKEWMGDREFIFELAKIKATKKDNSIYRDAFFAYINPHTIFRNVQRMNPELKYDEDFWLELLRISWDFWGSWPDKFNSKRSFRRKVEAIRLESLEAAKLDVKTSEKTGEELTQEQKEAVSVTDLRDNAEGKLAKLNKLQKFISEIRARLQKIKGLSKDTEQSKDK